MLKHFSLSMNCKSKQGCYSLQANNRNDSYYNHCSVCNSVSYAAALKSSQPHFSLYTQATDKAMQQRVAVALAWLGKEADLRLCFVDRKGLDVLLELLTDQRRDTASHKEAAGEMPTGFGVLVVLLYISGCRPKIQQSSAGIVSAPYQNRHLQLLYGAGCEHQCQYCSDICTHMCVYCSCAV